MTRGLAEGDDEAFRVFHERYFDRLLRLLVVVCCGDEEAEKDAVQETYLRVVRHARIFQEEKAFWSWLTVVARCAARDGGRKRRSYWKMLQDYARWFLNGESPRNRDTDCLEAYGSILENSLASLAPLDRQLIEAKYFEGASVRALARAERLTEKAVESRLGRSRRQLRELITRAWEERNECRK